MNKQNILKVAAAIEAHANQFDMNEWASGDGDLLHNCNTVGCIGGWTNALFDNGVEQGVEASGIHLGLIYDQAYELFYAASGPSVWRAVMEEDPFTATAEQAVTLLRAIADGTATFVCNA